MRVLIVCLMLLILSIPAIGQDVGAELERYCTNIADDVREQRHAVLEGRLAALRTDIEEKRAALDARADELADWIERREAFLALADDRLTGIYAAMRPDAAAEQLALIEPVVGAAILMRLKPRQASGVLAEMDTERAAELVTLISAARERGA